jgi:hypothetical protein
MPTRSQEGTSLSSAGRAIYGRPRADFAPAAGRSAVGRLRTGVLPAQEEKVTVSDDVGRLFGDNVRAVNRLEHLVALVASSATGGWLARPRQALAQCDQPPRGAGQGTRRIARQASTSMGEVGRWPMFGILGRRPWVAFKLAPYRIPGYVTIVESGGWG